MSDYLLVVTAVLIGCFGLVAFIRFFYRSGIATRIGVLVSVTAFFLAMTGFTIGHEGATLLRVTLALVVLAPIFTGLVIWTGKSIVAPAQQILKASQNMLAGDFEQEIQINANDEMGEISQAFHQINLHFMELSRAAAAIAEGDLSQTIHPRSDRDLLSQSLVKMVANLQEMIRQMSQSAASLHEASAQVNESANQFRQVIAQISTTMQEVSHGSAEQADLVSKTVNSVEMISQAIEGVAGGAQEQASAVNIAANAAADLSGQLSGVRQSAEMQAKGTAAAVETTRDSARYVRETALGMNKIKDKMDLSANKVYEMEAHSSKIASIVETIQDIAGQTNLLALNAAIEAARAGEQGKGFAVVSDEVRKLAERSAAATHEIAALIANIQKTIQETVHAMQESAAEVNHGVSLASQSEAALDRLLAAAQTSLHTSQQIAADAGAMANHASTLLDAMNTVSAVVEENTAATEEMAAGSGEAIQSVETIAQVSHSNSATLATVNASAQEMNRQVETLAASVHGLVDLSQTLQETVHRFRLA
jgi:methyl-accepting chemotaxis protein